MDAKTVEKVLALLETQTFVNWYEGKFAEYITGDMEFKTKKTHDECKEIILQELKKMLK